MGQSYWIQRRQTRNQTRIADATSNPVMVPNTLEQKILRQVGRLHKRAATCLRFQRKNHRSSKKPTCRKSRVCTKQAAWTLQGILIQEQHRERTSLPPQGKAQTTSQDQQGLHAHGHRLRKRSPEQLCFASVRAFTENMEKDEELQHKSVTKPSFPPFSNILKKIKP